jgi:hypothetical protein
MVSTTWRAERRWLTEPDVSRWVGASRLNLLRALPDHLAEPEVQTALERFVAHVGPAIERLAAARRDSNRNRPRSRQPGRPRR